MSILRKLYDYCVTGRMTALKRMENLIVRTPLIQTHLTAATTRDKKAQGKLSYVRELSMIGLKKMLAPAKKKLWHFYWTHAQQMKRCRHQRHKEVRISGIIELRTIRNIS